MKSEAELKRFVHKFSKLMELEALFTKDVLNTPLLLRRFTLQMQEIVNGFVKKKDEKESKDGPMFTAKDLEWLRYFYNQREILQPGVLWTSIYTLLPKELRQ